MAFIPVPGVAEIRMQFSYSGEQAENVYHVSLDGEWNLTNLNVMADAFLDWWTDNLRTGVPTTLTLQRILARDLTTATSPAIEYTAGMPTSGTDVSPQLPNNVSVAVKWTTGQAGRSYRGRTYHLGMTEAQVANNAISGANQTFLLSAYNALINDVEAAITGAHLVVVSKYTNNAPRTEGIFTEILAVSIDPTVDSQRRRLPGRGN
jgi:hypothetical protein